MKSQRTCNKFTLGNIISKRICITVVCSYTFQVYQPSNRLLNEKPFSSEGVYECSNTNKLNEVRTGAIDKEKGIICDQLCTIAAQSYCNENSEVIHKLNSDNITDFNNTSMEKKDDDKSIGDNCVSDEQKWQAEQEGGKSPEICKLQHRLPHNELEATQINHEQERSKSSKTLSVNVEFADEADNKKVGEYKDNQKESKETSTAEDLKKDCMSKQPEMEISKYQTVENYFDTIKTRLSEKNTVQQTVIEDEMSGEYKESASDINNDITGSLSCISIVSVEGAYKQFDADIEKECHLTQAMDGQDKVNGENASPDISNNKALRECKENKTHFSSVSGLKENLANGQDEANDTESFLIVDVRSLSQAQPDEKDNRNSTKQAVEQEKVFDTNPKAAVTKSYSTSKVIDALEVMCSSVPIGPSKQHTNMSVSKASLDKSVPVVSLEDSVSTLCQNSDTDNPGLPVISQVFSIKEEPQMEFSYGHSGAKELPSQSAMCVSRRKRKQPVLSPVVYKKAMINNDIVQIRVPVTSSTTQTSTEKSAPYIPKPVLAKPVSSESRVIVQLIKTPGNANCSKITPKVLTIAQARTQSSNTASSYTPVTAVTQVAGSTPSLSKNSVPKNKSNKEVSSTSRCSVQDDSLSINMEPLNIKNVGVSKITELIARKNPISTYKPPVVPENLKTFIPSRPNNPCYECGDTFLFKKSLHNHLSRRSMKISFKCEACKTTLTFTNKCQMLSHLRTHLNIKKSQAVPIHIKSDSIEISTQYDEMSKTKEFQFFDDAPTSILEEDNKIEQLVDSCHFCTYQYKSLDDRQSHYKAESLAKTNIFCDQCPIYMSNVCSMKAHKTIHAIDLRKSVPEFLVCPECGEVFPFRHLDDFLKHLKLQCFHLSRFGCFLCKNCKYTSSCLQTMSNHLFSNMDTYYKCGSCPMALRSLKNFYSHYLHQHGPLGTNSSAKTKIIYRCHCCETLIDDRVFLETHIQNHVNEMKALAAYMFNCLQCGQIFSEMEDLKAHYNQKHKMYVKRLTYCTFCAKDLGNLCAYVNHVLMNHTSNPSKVKVKFCDICGLVCVGPKMLRTHPCFMKIKIFGDPKALKEVKKTEPSNVSNTNDLPQKTKERLILPKNALRIKAVPSEPQSPPHFNLALPADVSPTCKACGTLFHDKIHRINHFKKHRNENIFICISCDNDTFKDYHQLRSHEIYCVSRKNKNTNAKKDISQPARKKRSPTKIKITRKENDYTVKLIPEADANGVVLPTSVEEKKCDKCDAVFTRETKLQEHIKLEHGLHPCHLCGLMHESQSSLKKHLILSHEGKKLRYYCFMCKGRKIERYFSEKVKLEKHLRQKHRLKKWDDSKIIPELPGLEGKGISPEPEKRKLEAESTVVNTEGSMPKKPRTKEDEKVLKCSKCLFTSGLREDFLKHILEHKTSSTVQCLECGLCFAVLPSLRKHLFMVHKVRDFEAYCATNDIKEPITTDLDAFSEIGRDRNESNTESDDEQISVSNPRECQVCYKEFENEAALKSHMRVHGMALIKRLRRKSHTPNGSKGAMEDTTQSVRRPTFNEKSSISQTNSDITNETLVSQENPLNATDVDSPDEKQKT